VWDKIKQFVYGALSILIPASLYIFIDSRRDRRHLERIGAEYDKLLRDLEQFRGANDELEQQLESISGEHGELVAQYSELRDTYDSAMGEYKILLEQTRGELSASKATVGKLF